MPLLQIFVGFCQILGTTKNIQKIDKRFKVSKNKTLYSDRPVLWYIQIAPNLIFPKSIALSFIVPQPEFHISDSSVPLKGKADLSGSLPRSKDLGTPVFIGFYLKIYLALVLPGISPRIVSSAYEFPFLFIHILLFEIQDSNLPLSSTHILYAIFDTSMSAWISIWQTSSFHCMQ